MSETPELPPIPELTAEHAHQFVCADYLESIARLIRRGAISGFDFAWNSSLEKPIGKFVGNCAMLIAPMETKIQQAIADYREEQSKQISVVDVTEQLKNHEPCDEESADDCAICNTKLS